MEQWVLIEDRTEVDAIWDSFDSLLDFKPNYYEKEECPFDFSKTSEPVVAYDISKISRAGFEVHDENGNYRTTEQITTLKSAFVECMGEDEYMYTLEWQGSTFLYNPRVETAYDYYMLYSNLPDDTRAYYPDFYPNGEYYLFVAKDFSWSYLTHPWQEKVWFYGAKLVEIIKKHEDKLGFVLRERG
jgi:hypothetical protein